MNFIFKSLSELSSEAAIFLISESLNLPKTLVNLDQHNHIANAIKADRAFGGKSGQIVTVLAPHGFLQKQVIILCLGKAAEATNLTVQQAGGTLACKLNQIKISEADLVIDTMEEFKVDLGMNLAIGIKLKNYAFNKHYVAKKEEHELALSKVNILATSSNEEAFAQQEAILNGVIITRNLVSESPNNLFPASFATECEKLKAFGVKVTVLNKEDLQALKMGALLGVAQGSANEPRVVTMEWHGNNSKPNEITALVGKGVTFDSGGINLKPSQGIADMKYDMSGAGVVTGTMIALASRKAKANIIGAIGLVENMPSSTAQRPGDVVVSMSGQTIEVDNTDAEGRLVLADVMWYVQEKYKPRNLIDLATLTGAIVIALGDYYAGLFSNNDELAEHLYAAADKVGEQIWRLPLHDFYDKQINSDIADVKNTGQSGRGAGSITAAQFLKRFIKDCAWAHLDIAGVTWTKQDNDICPKGATGFGVRLLNQYIMDNIEHSA
ncbi:MAG: leucyl aminopeptidase [Candidatus Midichloria sp.]|nr:MAG: leucyl aminopeptidase [Candidatus Midichloria sp.]